MSNKDPEPNAADELENVDFSVYRKPELAEKIASLIDVPQAIVTVVKWVAFINFVMWTVLWWIFGASSWGWLLGLYLYGTVLATFLGGLMGMLRIVLRGLDDVVVVFDLTLEITEQVSKDIEDMDDGKKRVPSTGQILAGVHDHVVLPIVREVVRRRVPFVGWIGVWFYRMTFARLAKLVMANVSPPVPPEERTADDEADTKTLLKRSLEYSANTSQWVEAAHRFVANLGRGLQRTVMVPLWTTFFVIAGVGILPLLAAWRWG